MFDNNKLLRFEFGGIFRELFYWERRSREEMVRLYGRRACLFYIHSEATKTGTNITTSPNNECEPRNRWS